ncbi:hypothetical protein CDAR_14431 [Caerostris darwini]|uniref:Uncharacterized protein n=1 Tax=Caerostris darwini TaxID=1538125 RepID=A0AAV4QDJ3_9ARAC|nr:hypothetical protein CDAR_14431 [Caerostris darwini]
MKDFHIDSSYGTPFSKDICRSLLLSLTLISFNSSHPFCFVTKDKENLLGKKNGGSVEDAAISGDSITLNHLLGNHREGGWSCVLFIETSLLAIDFPGFHRPRKGELSKLSSSVNRTPQDLSGVEGGQKQNSWAVDFKQKNKGFFCRGSLKPVKI